MSKKSKIKNSQQYNYLLLTAEIVTIALVISAFVAPVLVSATQSQSRETRMDCAIARLRLQA